MNNAKLSTRTCHVKSERFVPADCTHVWHPPDVNTSNTASCILSNVSQHDNKQTTTSPHTSCTVQWIHIQPLLEKWHSCDTQHIPSLVYENTMTQNTGADVGADGRMQFGDGSITEACLSLSPVPMCRCGLAPCHAFAYNQQLMMAPTTRESWQRRT